MVAGATTLIRYTVEMGAEVAEAIADSLLNLCLFKLVSLSLCHERLFGSAP